MTKIITKVARAMNSGTQAVNANSVWETVNGASISFVADSSAIYRVSWYLTYTFTDSNWGNRYARIYISSGSGTVFPDVTVCYEKNNADSGQLRTQSGIVMLTNLTDGDTTIELQTITYSSVNSNVDSAMIILETIEDV